jgi:hypothetical protein
VAIWVLGGAALRRALGSPWKLRLFNGAMAFLLVASLYPIFTE